MPFTYNPGATQADIVRMLITDTNAATPIFQDAEIQAFLTLSVTPLRAAATALQTIAGSQLLTLKVIQILDIKTDGRAMSTELRALAQAYRDQDDLDSIGFDYIEFADNLFTQRERIFKQALRGDLG